MNGRLLCWVSGVSLVIGASGTTAYADEGFTHRYYVAPMGAVAISQKDGAHDGDAVGGAALAIGSFLMPHIGVELVGDYERYTHLEHVFGGGLGANLYLSPDNDGVFVHANAQGGDRFVYNAGLGYDHPIFGGAAALRLEALYHKQDKIDAEPLFHFGFRLPFGKVSVPEPAAELVEVVPVEEPAPPEEAPPAEPPPATCQSPEAGQPVSFEGCKPGDTIVLHGVNFEFDKATLTLNAKTLLDQVADALQTRKDINIEIDGHTDGKGSAPYNQKLSEARATSVMKYLADHGVDQNRMASRGFGKTMPIADNETDEGREANRRVELKVIDSVSSAVQSSEDQSASPAEVGAEPASEAAAEPDSSPSPTSSEYAPELDSQQDAGPAPDTASDSASGEAAVPEQPESLPSSTPDTATSDEPLAPTEPAPAPRAHAVPDAADEAAPAAAEQAAPSDDGLAPTEPAPKP